MKNNAPSLPVPTESVEQQCLFRWAAFQSGRFPELALLYHVPNGGSRKKAEAGRFRAEGVKAGVPDLCLPVARGGFHGLYIELKRRAWPPALANSDRMKPCFCLCARHWLSGRWARRCARLAGRSGRPPALLAICSPQWGQPLPPASPLLCAGMLTTRRSVNRNKRIFRRLEKCSCRQRMKS